MDLRDRGTCYVRAERSTRLEWEGYDQVSELAEFGACA